MSEIMIIPLILMLNSLLFIYLKHPLSCGLILLTQTIFTALISGLMNYNYWYSYILFLIMIGGMLILFIYMTSIASNEKFKFSEKLLFIILLMSMIMISSLTIDYFYSHLWISIMDIKSQNYIFNNSWAMNKYFNFPNNLLTFILINYLFITLIMTVKITKFSYGPLRQKF
uniref:NADH-ubiquinone oxidoreductase chain 6 n=1 Tax=Hoplasoma unicolor TaxID=281577 RepID=A0A411D9R8_9CUCU|nr:NADH dehydrogenase subunit 6 [Hoplasoma unicolor]QAY81948.1 NADH dehydrogenase subunit 6 [Hoplasoma unicolor]